LNIAPATYDSGRVSASGTIATDEKHIKRRGKKQRAMKEIEQTKIEEIEN